MRTCSDCGYEITFATEAETGERIPLDPRPLELTGNDRYYYPDPQNEPDRVQRMGAGHVGYGYGDHRRTCPRVRREGRL